MRGGGVEERFTVASHVNVRTRLVAMGCRPQESTRNFACIHLQMRRESERERERENFLDSNIADGISQCCGLSSTGGDYYYYYYYSLLVLIAGSLFPEVRDLE